MDHINVKKKLIEIGEDLAFNQNGKCIFISLSNDTNTVSFYCINATGGPFIKELNYREIESIWGIPGRILYKFEKDNEIKCAIISAE